MKIEEVKRNLNKKVHYKDSKNYLDNDYLFTGCIIRRDDKGNFYYQAELQSMNKSSSILICKLEDVQLLESEVKGNG